MEGDGWCFYLLEEVNVLQYEEWGESGYGSFDKYFLFALFFLSLGYVLSSRCHRGGSLLYFQSGEDMGREEG